jgi:hypothetical protein
VKIFSKNGAKCTIFQSTTCNKFSSLMLHSSSKLLFTIRLIIYQMYEANDDKKLLKGLYLLHRLYVIMAWKTWQCK